MKKGITIYLDKEDYETYLYFKNVVRKDRNFINISNFIRIKIREYIEDKVK
jgi:hypothetical protein